MACKPLLVLALTACAGANTATTTHTNNVNFILVLVDDMGYADVGAYRFDDGETLPGGRADDPEVIAEEESYRYLLSETPRIDELAASGMRFTDMHAGASVCTPARAAILTGRLGPRTGVTSNFGESSLYGLNLTEPVISELLSEQLGYDTMAIGKWHLGHSHEYSPVSRGFDRFYG